MQIPLVPASSVPLYRQIEIWLRQAITNGQLSGGTRLPASRVLAQSLGVGRVTVDHAYQELAADGLVEGRGSGGTLVRPVPPLPLISQSAQVWPAWQERLARQRSDDLLHPAQSVGETRGLIDLASGGGDMNLFDAPGFYRVLNHVRLRDGADTLEYGDPRGYAPLRNLVAGILASQGLMARPEEILITAGSQQAIALVVTCLLRPGDAVVVEQPCYPTALEFLRAHGLRIVPVPVDQRGMRLDILAGILEQESVGLIYTMPTFQNPSGICMDLQRRLDLLGLARRNGVPILEDDFAGDLRFEGQGCPALKALDDGGNVLYVSTFSKMLLPGLRTGYLVVNGPANAILAEHKRLLDLACASLVQRTLAEFIGIGKYQLHVRRAIRLYRRRRDVLVAALRRHLSEARFEVPAGGLFLWLALPNLVSEYSLIEACRQNGVAVAGGSSFGMSDGSIWLRLNFAASSEADLETAAQILAQVWSSLTGAARDGA